MPTIRMSFWFLLILISPQLACAEWSESFYDDADLNNVFFVDAQTGWCVGSRGVILHTADAGATWRRQSSPLDCTLESVFFIDTRTGWAVGGQAVPYVDRSESILLRTDDGGMNWTRVSTDLIPWLVQVQFFDRNHGVACGQSSSLYPTGIVTTKDGGLTWTGVRGRIAGACNCLEMVPHRYGFGVTSKGQVFALEQGSTHLLSIDKSPVAERQPRCLTVAAPQSIVDSDRSTNRIVLGGNRGMLRTSADGGKTWHTINHVAGPIDINGMTSKGNFVWACGSPGNVMLRSSDAGVSWQAFRLENKLPLSSVCFVDHDHGWAVGSMGTIVHTHDGGRTWIQQRAVGRRAAIMVATSDLPSVPWEQLADLSAIEGFRMVIVSLDADQSDPGELPKEVRANVAVQSIGANTAIALPRDARTNDLATQLQIWKPDAILLHDPQGNSSKVSDMQSFVTTAIQLANSNNNRLNLAPHQISRIAVFRHSSATSLTERVAIGLGATTFELASQSRSLFTERHRTPPGVATLHLLANNSADVPNPKNLMSAASQARGRTARRLQDKINADFRHQEDTVVARRNIRAIANNDDGSSVITSVQLLHQLPAAERSDLLFELACQAERDGDYDSANSMLERIAFETPEHRLADAATQMLLAFKASAEVELARRRSNVNVATTVSADGVVPISDDLTPTKPIQESRRASFEVTSAATATMDARLTELMKIQKIRPGMFFSPLARFPIAAFQRRANQTEEATRFYRSQLGSQNDIAWRAVAASELGMIDKKSAILKPVTTCALVDAKPYLDGDVDDAIWMDATPIDARNAAGMNVQFRTAFDGEFLYISAECQKLTNEEYASNDSEPRRRDIDMNNVDHVRIRIDCDRDYATYWEFSIDSQGNGREQLNDNPTWNPIWYIANQQDESAWRIEAAIHLDELCTDAPRFGDAWGIEFARLSPANRPAVWPTTKSSTSTSPKDFGIMQFGVNEP